MTGLSSGLMKRQGAILRSDDERRFSAPRSPARNSDIDVEQIEHAAADSVLDHVVQVAGFA